MFNTPTTVLLRYQTSNGKASCMLANRLFVRIKRLNDFLQCYSLSFLQQE